MNRSPQKCPEDHRSKQKRTEAPEMHITAQKCTKVHTSPQKCTQVHRSAQKYTTEVLKNAQKFLEVPKSAQKPTEVHKSAQKFTFLTNVMRTYLTHTCHTAEHHSANQIMIWYTYSLNINKNLSKINQLPGKLGVGIKTIWKLFVAVSNVPTGRSYWFLSRLRNLIVSLLIISSFARTLLFQKRL